MLQLDDQRLRAAVDQQEASVRMQEIAIQRQQLQVDNLPVGTKSVSIEPGGTTSVTFDPFSVSRKNMRGTVSIDPDALETDNSYHYVV